MSSKIRKIRDKIRDGYLREVLAETRWIYHYASRYKKGIIGYSLLNLLITLISLGASLVSKYLIDAVTGHDGSHLLPIIFFYVFFNLGRMLLSACARRLSAELGVRASNEIRADVFRRFLDIDWQASLDYHSGDLLSRISSDVSTVSGSILGFIPTFITTGFQFVGALVLILIFDPVMALLALVSAPFIVFLSRFFFEKIREYDKKSQHN